MSKFKKIKECFFNKIKNKTRQKDDIIVKLPGLYIKLSRNLTLETPHELTIVLPRIEMRRKNIENDGSSWEEEIIYNSITIVHAPRHELGSSKTKE